MIDLKPYTQFYFLGIGGIGMSAIARYFNANGFSVTGYDKTPSALTDELKSEGIEIHFDDNIKNIPAEVTSAKEKTLIVYTPAIPKDHKEYNYLKEQGYKIHKRSEVLAALTAGKTTIAVAGTHGKTSTAAIITHILKSADVPFFSFLGGIASNYNTNFLAPKKQENAELIVVEADEFDRSFLRLDPDIAVITAVESDHLDIYGTLEELEKAYSEFAHKVKPGGTLIVHEDVRIPLPDNRRILRYGTGTSSRVKASNIHIAEGHYHFDETFDEKTLHDLQLGIPGRHNIENTLASIAATWPFVQDKTVYQKALPSFKGVHRRFEVILRNENIVFIDDYAHHPTEIRVTIETVNELFKGKKIVGIFQPHLFSRTKDLATEFAQSLSLLDEVFLLPIYPARELPMEGVTSQLILDKISANFKKLVSKENLVQEVLDRKPDVVITIGAGDIDRMVKPLKEALSNYKREEVAR
jgi:UDP-N-acetylmuramate--alanine ligase